MKILEKIVHIISNIIYILVGVYAIVSIPSVVGYRPLIVLSGSMEPTYPVGSVLYYKSVAKSEIKEKDVITFELNGTVITHRVNRIDGDNYYTKGDANPSEDSVPLSYDNIMGKTMNFNIPYIGYYIKFVNDNMYLLVVAVVVLLLEFVLSNQLLQKAVKKSEN